MDLSSTTAGERYYIVRFEAVYQSPEAVFEFFFELLIGEVGCKVRFQMKLRPYLIPGMKKLVGEDACVHAVECCGLHSDVVEADVYRPTLKPSVFFLVESIAVEVVVQRVVVNHLRDR